MALVSGVSAARALLEAGQGVDAPLLVTLLAADIAGGRAGDGEGCAC